MNSFNYQGLPQSFAGFPLHGGLGGVFTGGANLSNGGQIHFHGPNQTVITGAYIKQGPQHGQYLNGYEAAMCAFSSTPFFRK